MFKVLNEVKLNDNYCIQDIDMNGELIRVLKIGDTYSSMTYMNDKKYDLVLDYMNFYKLIFHTNVNVSNLLVLGGGCFSFPKYAIAHHPESTIDVVELLKPMIDLSHEYFYLDNLYHDFANAKERLTIYNEDAKDYLFACSKKYDAIFIDLFDGGEPLDVFYKGKLLKQNKKLLNNNGLIMINYIIRDFQSFNEVKDELHNTFKYLRIISLSGYENIKNPNVLIFASDTEIDFNLKCNFVDVTI